MRIAPKVHADVKSAEAVYDSASGTYRCGWEILDDNRIRVSLEVPFGAEAEVQLPYADTSVYLDESNPLFASVRDGVCHVKAGSYRAEYPASEQLKKTYSTESSMEELLNHPAVRAFSVDSDRGGYDSGRGLSHVSAHRRRGVRRRRR